MGQPFLLSFWVEMGRFMRWKGVKIGASADLRLKLCPFVIVVAIFVIAVSDGVRAQTAADASAAARRGGQCRTSGRRTCRCGSWTGTASVRKVLASVAWVEVGRRVERRAEGFDIGVGDGRGQREEGGEEGSGTYEI